MRDQSQQTRKYTTVVFADMVGYSSLTARDEATTHAVWMDFLGTCLRPEADRFGSNVIRLLGDGCLLSFDQPDQAFAWSRAVRSQIVEMRDCPSPRWPSLSMRFGIHYCEVIEDSGDIYGDGVNITKRLQERAQPDGILISDQYHGLLGQDNDQSFRYLGALQYKNLPEPVPTYEAILAGSTVSQRSAESALPSVAILPFRNLTGNSDLDYFGEGLIDDIIQSLACLRELQVISRGSTLPFANQFVDPREIARILSVRYVMQGTMKASADTIRLTTSFEDAQNGETLFGEKCEFSHSKLFDVQDNIVRQIISRISPNVRASELEKALRKPPENFTAYQCTLQALDLMRSLKKPDFAKAKALLEQAISLDPQFVLPVATLVRWHCINIGQGWCDDRDTEVAAAKECANKGLTIDRQSPLAIAAYGHVKSYLERDLTTAMVYFDRARQLGPSHALTWILSSATLCYLGKGEEAVEHARRALELSPNDQELYQFYDFLTLAHYCCGAYDDALVWAKLSYAENPHYTSNLRQMVVCNMALSEKEAAEQFAKELLNHDPGFNLATYAQTCPFQDQDMRSSFMSHLKNAGLPQKAA